MPHSCQAIVKHHYDAFLELFFSPEGGRVIETLSAAAAIFVIAASPIRKFMIAILLCLLLTWFVSACQSGAVSTLAKELWSCRVRWTHIEANATKAMFGSVERQREGSRSKSLATSPSIEGDRPSARSLLASAQRSA
jgi:hypothetical protein